MFLSLQTAHEGRIYTLKLFCDKDYPDKPPTVHFYSRIHTLCLPFFIFSKHNIYTSLVSLLACSFCSSIFQGHSAAELKINSLILLIIE